MEVSRLRPGITQNRTGWLCFIALVGAMCAVGVFRSHVQLAHNSFSLTPPHSFSIYKADFICFYTAAQVGLEKAAGAYDTHALGAAQGAITNAVGAENPLYTPYAYPPFVEVVFRQFLRFPYERAYYVWLACTYLVTACAIALLWRKAGSPWERALAGIVIPAAFPFFSLHALMSGQTTVFAVVIIALVVSFKKTHPLLAGLVCGLGIYKPPLFVVLAIIAILKREWRFLIGCIVTVCAVVGLSAFLLGTESWIAFLKAVSGYAYGGVLPDGRTLPPGKGMGLLSASVILAPSNTLGWMLFALLSTLAIFIHHRMASAISAGNPGAEIYEICSSVILTYLLSIQAINYDAAILIVPFTLLLSLLRQRQELPLTVIVSLCLLMVGGIFDTENGNLVCPGFLVIVMFWFSVVSTGYNRRAMNNQCF